MERQTVIGIVAVAVVGLLLAAAAFYLMSPSVPASSPIAAAPAPDAPRTTASASTPPTERAPTPPPNTRAAPRPAPASTDPALARPELGAPPRAAPPGAIPLDELLVATERFRSEPVFAGLPPDASPAEIIEHLSGVMEDVEQLEGEYRAIAHESAADDPGIAGEALMQAASLYEHVAAQLPPPVSAQPDPADPWSRQREEVLNGLHKQAQALRDDAVLIHSGGTEMPDGER